MTAACPKCGHNPSAVVVRQWEFTVDREVYSLNAHRTNAGTRWGQREYRDNRTAWIQWFIVHGEKNGSRGATVKRRVTLTRLMGWGQREFDRDNLQGGMKICVDAMVRAKLLVDDKPKWLELHHAQERGTIPGLRVLLEELA